MKKLLDKFFGFIGTLLFGFAMKLKMKQQKIKCNQCGAGLPKKDGLFFCVKCLNPFCYSHRTYHFDKCQGSK